MRLDKIRQELGCSDESIHLLKALVVMSRNDVFKKLLKSEVVEKITKMIPNQKRKLNAAVILAELLKNEEYKKKYSKGALKHLVTMVLKGQTDDLSDNLVKDVLDAQDNVGSTTIVKEDIEVKDVKEEATEEAPKDAEEKETITVKVTEKKNGDRKTVIKKNKKK